MFSNFYSKPLPHFKFYSFNTTTSGNLLFDDEVSSIQKEVDELTRRGVHKIIALGHAGHGVDKLIASRVRGVDIVVGGHTNTFLYNGKGHFSNGY